MIRPSPDVLTTLAIVSRQHPDLVEWLGEWYRHELERLPSTVNNVTLAQGRCQVLGEVHTLLTKAPDMAAQPRR
jgi:hypothetical protein